MQHMPSNRVITVKQAIVLMSAIFLILTCPGFGSAAGVWSAYSGIGSGYNPPIGLVTASPYACNSQVQFYLYTVQDLDRRFTAPSTFFFDPDTFANSDAYTWAVKDSNGGTVGSWLNGDNTSNMVSSYLTWIAPSTPCSNLTIYCTVKDDPKALGIGDTGTRDDPDKVYSLGGIRVGSAFISNLSGNVAGSYISGTDLSVNMYVVNMYYNMDHTISVRLGGSDLANGSSHVNVSPVSPSGQPILRTDGVGNWQSASTPGYVYFDSTHLLGDGSTGDLNVKLVPSSGTTYYSNSITPVTVYNKAYVLSNPNATICGDDAAGAVGGQASDMNHSVTSTNSACKAEILSNLPTYTVFYTYSHGGYNSTEFPGQVFFRDCDSYRGDDLQTHCLGSGDVATAVAGKSGVPQYNLVHIDCCDSGDADDMAIAFGILDSSGGVKTDRAYLGFSGPVDEDQEHVDWTNAVWTRLQLGDTLAAAVSYANGNYNCGGTATVIGDSATTLHKLY